MCNTNEDHTEKGEKRKELSAGDQNEDEKEREIIEEGMRVRCLI